MYVINVPFEQSTHILVWTTLVPRLLPSFCDSFFARIQYVTRSWGGNDASPDSLPSQTYTPRGEGFYSQSDCIGRVVLLSQYSSNLLRQLSYHMTLGWTQS